MAPAAAAGVVAGLDVRVADRAALVELLRTVSAEIERVMSGKGYERRGGGFPPLDTGILGPVPGPTGTSVIVGFGASLFDDRFGLGDQRPDELIVMPRFKNDRLVDPGRSHGDVSLVVQADTQDAANHALRQVLRRTRGDLAVRWVREGFNTLDRHAPPGTAPARNLMGFKDGTANPHVDDAAAMDAHVWIQPEDGQPAWAVGGTFQAIRVIRMQVEFWDRTRLNEQEALIGRHRDSGAPLGSTAETRCPDVRHRPVVAHRPGQPAHAGQRAQRHPAPAVQLRRRRRRELAARPGAVVHVLPTQPGRRVPDRADPPRRRGAGGVHPPARRRFLRRPPRPG